MNALKINIVFLFLTLFPFFGNFYSQSSIQTDTTFSYYRFLPYYERFKNDSIEAEIFKRNKVKSVIDYKKSFRYGKYDKGLNWERRELDIEGFTIKLTNPDIIVSRSGRLNDSSFIDSTTFLYDNENRKIKEIVHLRNSPEENIFSFDSNGFLIAVDNFSNNVLTDKENYEYDFRNNKIIINNSDDSEEVSGFIYELERKKIKNILYFDEDDATLYKTMIYRKNMIIINTILPSTTFYRTSKSYNKKGQLVKEIREREDSFVIEEYSYGSNWIKNVFYIREFESNYSIFKPMYFRLIYLNENGLPISQIERWWNYSFDKITFIYEYYE